MKIDIPYETVDKIVVAGLRETLEMFERDLMANKQGANYLVCFDLDLDKDRKILKKHREACKLLLSWYGDRD